MTRCLLNFHAMVWGDPWVRVPQIILSNPVNTLSTDRP